MSSVPSYGRRTSRRDGLWAEKGPTTYTGPTYYDRPAIKPGHYGWLITCYLWIGGIAGASQIIAAAADLFGRGRAHGVVRSGRYVALLGAIASPAFLIRDLHTPKRFYNMLRIFRPTSPMSIGSWTLAGFGTLSGVTAAAQLVADLRSLAGSSAGGKRGRGQREGTRGWAAWLATCCGLPAAAFGCVMSCYTGSLLATTSVPFWATAFRLLPPLFGSSAMSTGAAATSLAMNKAGASDEAHASMERIALLASAIELALTLAAGQEWKKRQVDTPLKADTKMALAYRGGALGLGVLAPLIIHAIHVFSGHRSNVAAAVADSCALAGGFAQRAVFTFGGKSSAELPKDYFHFTQPSTNGRGEAA